MKKLLLVLAMVLSMVGCIGGKNAKEGVIGNTYTLEGVIPGKEIVIEFSDTSIVGHTGVNQYFANYVIDGKKISITSLGSTKIAGPKNMMEQERKYFTDLLAASEVKLTNSLLELKTKDGVTLKFIPKK